MTDSKTAGTDSNADSDGLSAAERAAIKERAQEVRAKRARGEKADPEAAMLVKIAEMPQPDRGTAERIHAVVTASAPELRPKLWYGMPAYALGGKVVAFFNRHRSSIPGTRPWASTTVPNWTTETCGRPPMP